MALKDWKKSLDETHLVHFYNEKTDEKLRLTSIFLNNKPNIWRVVGGDFVWGESGNILKDNLKSKSQALAFAKRYMAVH